MILAFEKLVDDLILAGGRPLLIGGYVRDKLLGLRVKDRDLEVFRLPAPSIIKICRRHGKVMQVGSAFAVLKVVFPNGEEIDVSMPRRERTTGLGHKDFQVSADPDMSVEEAASRRDLTINAISMDPKSGQIIDPVGGLQDLKQGIIRHIGPRFEEDPLRVLRVIQFSARFGFEIHDETFLLCRRMTDEGFLEHLPRERVEEEIRKLVVRGRPGSIRTALHAASGMNVFKHLFPELYQLQSIPQDPRYHAEGDCLIHTILTVDHMASIAMRDGLSDEDRFIHCLAAMAHDLGKILTTEFQPDGSITSYRHDRIGMPLAETLLRRITVNQRILDPALALIRTHMRPLHLSVADKVTDAAIRRLARDVLPATLMDLARLVEADTMASHRADGSHGASAHVFLKARAAELGVSTQPPTPVFLGRDLVRMATEGCIPARFATGGPHFKPVLDAVYEAQMDGNISNPEEAAEFICKMLRDGSAGNG